MKTTTKDFIVKLAVIVTFLLVAIFGIPAMCHAQKYEVQGNEYVAKSTARTKSEPKKTQFTWTDAKGTKYPIYMSGTGSCFIIKKSSKTGKEYRSYLGPEVSMDICKRMNVEYKGKAASTSAAKS